MERQACEILIGVGIGAAIVGAVFLFRHLSNAAKRADKEMAIYVRSKEDSKQ